VSAYFFCLCCAVCKCCLASTMSCCIPSAKDWAAGTLHSVAKLRGVWGSLKMLRRKGVVFLDSCYELLIANSASEMCWSQSVWWGDTKCLSMSQPHRAVLHCRQGRLQQACTSHLTCFALSLHDTRHTHQVKHRILRILRMQVCIEHQHWANAQLMHLHMQG